MEIVFLDRLTVGDVNLDGIANLGNLTSYNLTTPEETSKRIIDAEVIITNKVYIGKSEVENAKNLKLVCVAATGYNNVDLDYLKNRGIKVINVKDYSTDSVAQITLTMMLNLASNFDKYDKDSKNGNWSNSPIFTLLNHNIFQLKDKKLGIIGFGKIGKKVAELAKAFGMEILVGGRPGELYEEKRIDFNELLKESDFVTLHCPLSDYTKNLFSYEQFKLMKNSSYLINTARGPIVNEHDLVKALDEGLIAGAAIDVMNCEPPVSENELLRTENILITPHIAWAAKESRESLINGVIKNIIDFKNGDLISL